MVTQKHFFIQEFPFLLIINIFSVCVTICELITKKICRSKKMIRSCEEIIELLKDEISIPVGNRKMFLEDVAAALRIHPSNLRSRKKRNSIPFKEIIEFCDRYFININQIMLKAKA